MKNYIWVVAELNMEQPIPQIKCFKYQKKAEDFYHQRGDELSNAWSYSAEYKKGDTISRVFGNQESDEIQYMVQLIREELAE